MNVKKPGHFLLIAGLNVELIGSRSTEAAEETNGTAVDCPVKCYA
jgi:hypothetical protein